MKGLVVVVFKILLVIVLYLSAIAITGWFLIKSYDLFLYNINKKVVAQTTSFKSEIDEIKNLKSTNPSSLKDVQDYDKKHNTHFYNMVESHQPLMGAVDMKEASSVKTPRVLPKEIINNAFESVIIENEQKISDIKDSNKGFWSELPPLSTLLLAGIGIFLTSLITNFGIFFSGLITSFRKWLFGKSSNQSN